MIGDDDIEMQDVLFAGVRRNTVVFTNIYDTVTNLIDGVDVAYVIGCMAWFSNKRVLKSMSQKKGCCIITMPDGICKLKTYIPLYKTVNSIPPYGTIRIISNDVSNGYLMHHKFIIALDANMQPIWVINGSCNFSQNSEKNRENIVVHYEAHILNAFLDEFNYLLPLSVELNL